MTFLLAAMLLLILTGCASSSQAAEENTYTQIDQETAKQMMATDDGHVVVDVRRQDEYEAGHIPGAILIPNESIGCDSPEALPDYDQIILIYCRSGNRSKQAAQKLVSMGYKNVYEFGGIIDWTGEIVTTEEEEAMESTSETEMQITITAGEYTITAILYDNAAGRAFWDKLPLTLPMQNLYGREMCYRFGAGALPDDDAADTGYEIGDISYWPPRGSLVILYKQNGEVFEQQPIGHTKDDVSFFDGMPDIDVIFERAGEKPTYMIDDVFLNSGYAMPVIGLGTWTLSNEQAEESVYAAMKCGMRLIDTARYYGCEVGVGRGLRRAIDDGIVTREEVFITSKIMPSDYDRAAQGIDDSLADLGVDYLDLMLIHQPGWNDEAVYKAMEDAVHDRKVRSIGISNYYTKDAVDEVLSYAEIMPAVIQNENHLYYQNSELQEYVRQYGIVVESWYPFGGRGHTQDHFGNETIMAIAEAHGKSPAQVILRWQVQAGFIAIPGSSNTEHIAENFDIFDFELTDDEMQSIFNLNRGERYENW